LVGLTTDELRKRKTVEFYYDPEDRKKVVQQLQDTGEIRDWEVRLRRADGAPIWTLFSLVMTEHAGEPIVIGGVYDVTRRKEAEEKLRLYREIFMNSIDGITVLDLEGRILERNPSHERATGYGDDELIGKPAATILGEEQIAKIAEGLAKGGPFRGEVIATRKDGSRVPIDISAFSIPDKHGRPLYYVAMGRNISEMKKAQEDLARANQELRDAQVQLVQSEKMAALGMLVAGIAHEINTPVGAVKSMHNTLVRGVDKLKKHLEANYPEEYGKDSKLQGIFELIGDANQVIDTGGKRVTEIIRRLRSFARMDEAELKEADIHEGLEDTLMLLHHEVKHHIEIKKNYGDVPPISCYPGRLNQVFLNLLNNARQAIQGEGEITITTFVADGKVHVAIGDNGAGIADKDLAKVFDPGFTTKGVGVGTGLGLSIVYKIIQEHHGEIKVESEADKGSTFTAILPMNLDEQLGVS
jgi:PAS domain S-box-containing protein